MLSFLMGKRKRRGERSRMGNNHSKIEENGQSSGAVKDSIRGRGNETNLTDDEKGSDNLIEAVPEIISTNELSEVPREAENPDFSTSDTFTKTTQESDKTCAIQDLTVEHTYRILDKITPKMDSLSSYQVIIGGATNEKEENGEKVKDSGSSSVGLNPTESPITCHEREQVLRITRVHSLDSSSEDPRGPNQSSSPVQPVVVTKCDDGRGASKSAAKTLTDLEKSRKAFFMGLLEETVEEIYPEDVKYVETSVVLEHSQQPPDPSLERLQISTNCAVSDESTIDCGEIDTVETLDNVVAHTHGEVIAQPKEIQSMSSIVCDLDEPTNSIVSPTLNSRTLDLKEPLKENFVEETCREERSSYEQISCSDLRLSKHNNDSEEDTQKCFEEMYDDVMESTIVTDNNGINVLTTEEEEHSDMECDDEESGIVGNSDALSLNEISLTNTIDERVTDSGLENPDLDDVLHTELDEISLEDFETAGCETSDSISIDLVITQVKCDGVSGQAPEVVIEKLENGPENSAEDPGQSGNDVKLDEVGNCVETGEGESDDRPRGGLGTGLPAPRRGLIAPVHCAIPRDEHRVDMLTLSNGTYETFPRSNLSLASSSDESIGTKVKKHVRWADTDEGRSLESYDSYSSCSSSEDEESGSEDEGAGVDQELEVARDVPADVNEDDDGEDEDDTSDSDEESESDEEENKTGADDTFTESDISVVNLESANESNDDKLEEDECDEDEDEEVEEKMEDDETETKTEENLVETITRLQEVLLTKAACLERAQSDLDAAVLEADKARKKIERLQEELDSLKRRNADLQNSIETGSLTCDANEQLECRIRKLENELQSVKSERNLLESRLSSLEQERDEEIRMVQRALEETMQEQTEREAKYQKEFETERTLSSQRELQMLEDFEWKLRETEKNAKKKVEGAEAEAAKRIHDMEAKLVRAEADLERLAELKLCEIELKQLKVTSSEQRRTLRQVTRQFEELQVNEKILQEEVNRLRLALDKEKLTVTNLQTIHKEELAEKDRKQRVKLEVQVSQITSEWEDRLRRELAKLKGNLENTHREEKIVAVDMIKLLKEQEIAALKQGWEKKVKEFKEEIANYKQKLDTMENSHREEIENAQTCSDRDALDLRRKMDKLDMEYQSKIEKLQEQHEAELNDLRQECERKIIQIDSTYQLQAGTTRTTIELVKQQMMNENQTRIDRLQAVHRQQMEEQWEMLDLERRNEVRGLEDAHRAALEQLRKELDEIRKAVTPTSGKQSNRQRTPNPESAKQMVIDQLNHEATNPYSCGSMDGIEAVSAGSDAEKILFAKLQQLTRQANEDKAEIERLRLRLEEKECVNMTQHTAPHQQQQQQQQQRGQQHPPHPTRRNRKRRN